jgi:RimJ/RimL family protein N-acetyltransferase
MIAEPLRAPSVTLDPLTVEHAEAMTAVLADPALYVVTGGDPPTTEELRARYARQVLGRSPDGSEGWLNWIVVDAISEQPAGYLQVTIRPDDGHDQAELAWVIGTGWQGRGFATQAAKAVADWLAAQGITTLIAHIRSGHRPSERVAEAVGLQPSSIVVDGEIRWMRSALAP